MTHTKRTLTYVLTAMIAAWVGFMSAVFTYSPVCYPPAEVSQGAVSQP